MRFVQRVLGAERPTCTEVGPPFVAGPSEELHAQLRIELPVLDVVADLETIAKDLALAAPFDVAVLVDEAVVRIDAIEALGELGLQNTCLLYTSDAADERSSVDLGGRRIIKKKM